MDKNVCRIMAPDESSPGKYALVLTIGMGMTGLMQQVFYADGLVALSAGQEHSGWRAEDANGRTVAVFPAGTLFSFVPRSQVRLLTQVEDATERSEENAAVLKALSDAKEPEPEPAVVKSIPGQYL
jgi:hypothetical protein